MASAETDGMGGNGSGEWLSISCFITGGPTEAGGEFRKSFALRSKSGVRLIWSGVEALLRDEPSSHLSIFSSQTFAFLMHRFSAISSDPIGDGFGTVVVRSWGPHISPERLRGRACLRRGSGDWHSGRGMSDSGNDSLGMCGSFTEGS